MVSPTIRNLKVTRILVDDGAGLNLILPAVVKKLQIPDGDLEETGTFQGVNPGRSQPKGKITLPVTFGGELNHKTERIVFDVAEIPLPYNGILGRPALAKFMAASHYAYNMLKMPGPMNIITVPSDKKDALICADQLYREAVAAAAAKAPAPADGAPGGKKTGETLAPTPASAPLRGVALPLRTCQRAPPARARSPELHHQRPRRCPSRRTARGELLP